MKNEEISLTLEEIKFHLYLTSSLIATVFNSFLSVDTNKIYNERVFTALFGHSEASNFCHDSKYLIDNFYIIEERINDAVKMLDGIIEDYLKSSRESKERK